MQRDAGGEARRPACWASARKLALEAHVHVGDRQLQVAQNSLEIGFDEAFVFRGVSRSVASGRGGSKLGLRKRSVSMRSGCNAARRACAHQPGLLAVFDRLALLVLLGSGGFRGVDLA